MANGPGATVVPAMHRAAILAALAVLAALGFLLIASPAYAAGTAIPEPSSAGLFALGVLGVIVGRYSSRGKRD